MNKPVLQSKAMRTYELGLKGNMTIEAIAEDIFGKSTTGTVNEISTKLSAMRRSGMKAEFDKTTRIVTIEGEYTTKKAKKAKPMTYNTNAPIIDFATQTIDKRVSALENLLNLKAKQDPAFLATAVTKLDEMIVEILSQ